MRMWMIHPSLLCKNHLLGEHGELHKHRHIFIKQYSIAGRKGQIEPMSMKKRHDELAGEMLNRGYKHESSYRQPDLSYLPLEDRLGKVDVVMSAIELEKRCKECAQKIREKITL